MTGWCPYIDGTLKEAECHHDGYCSDCPYKKDDDKELFEIIRKHYAEENSEYLRKQVKTALQEPSISKEETLEGLVDWVMLAGCSGLNEKYRQYVLSAIGYLQI